MAEVNLNKHNNHENYSRLRNQAGAGKPFGASLCSTHIFMSTMTKDEINVSLFDEVKKLQIENRDLRGDCEHFTNRIKEMVAREMNLERENARLKDELDRLVEIETAARQWWQAECRHSLIAACKLGEALGYQVIWPEGHISSNITITDRNKPQQTTK
jgi:regulator of replication initiation timing